MFRQPLRINESILQKKNFGFYLHRSSANAALPQLGRVERQDWAVGPQKSTLPKIDNF
jgi:hypothetical protein